MITGLRAQNFKSWKDTGDLRIAPLTGLFGTNSSGKTSILQALLLLKQSAEFPEAGRALFLGDERSLIDLGTFPALIHRHSVQLQLHLQLSWTELPESGRMHYSFEEVNDQLRLYQGVCELGSDALRVEQSAEHFRFSRNGEPEVESHSPWFFPESPPSDPTSSLRWALAKLKYLGPLRQRPRRAPYVWSGSAPWDVGPDGGEFAQALLARVKGESTLTAVAAALHRMRLIDAFRMRLTAMGRRDYEILLRQTKSSAEVLLPDVGFGVSQVLPVLVLCYYADEGSTLVIEQPELHLHPAAQSELADVLIDVVKNRDMQIILESHSEHLLRRLQRRIAEGQFAAADAALYFCEMENGASKCTPLEITDDGFIRNWPKDFFGDEIGELAAITEEAMKRRLAKAK